jgi:hypothetical protein
MNAHSPAKKSPKSVADRSEVTREGSNTVVEDRSAAAADSNAVTEILQTQEALRAISGQSELLTAEEIAALLALPVESEAPPRETIPRVVSHAEMLVGFARRFADKLVAGGAFTLARLDALERAVSVLRRVDSARVYKHGRQVSDDVFKKRAHAEKVKLEAVEALAYFCRNRPQVVALVASIRPGVGDIDLLDDLSKAAGGVEQNLDLVGAPLTATLGENPVAAILAARADLLEALGQRRLDADDVRYRRLKNRAYSVVKPEVDELVATGRYVFRNSPEILTLFVTPATERRRKNRAREEQPEEPLAPSPV